ncbi:MAG: hypothetical protein ACTSSH_11190 [Candidatus Heimdallarchaeota archaeon]
MWQRTRSKRIRSYIRLFSIAFCYISINLLPIDSNQLPSLKAESADQFPFVGQRMLFEVTQTTGSLIASSGTLEVNYHSMMNATAIYGSFHVEVISLIEVYNETADGNENLVNRHLNIDSSDTYIIYIFMEYFFEWVPGEVTPTPMWLLPEDLEVNQSVKFWNYYGNCSKSQSISIMDSYYEVFVYRIITGSLNMTLMYGQARHNQDSSEWHGLLFYMSAKFIEPSTNRQLNAYLLNPMAEINKRNIITVTAAFYSIITIGAVVYRVRKRRDLVGGEV